MGNSHQGRSELILQATGRTALRKGDWVMIPPYQGPAVARNVNIELGNAPEYQLYNLNTDLGQEKDLASEEADKLREMIATYEKIRGLVDPVSGEVELK